MTRGRRHVPREPSAGRAEPPDGKGPKDDRQAKHKTQIVQIASQKPAWNSKDSRILVVYVIVCLVSDLKIHGLHGSSSNTKLRDISVPSSLWPSQARVSEERITTGNRLKQPVSRPEKQQKQLNHALASFWQWMLASIMQGGNKDVLAATAKELPLECSMRASWKETNIVQAALWSMWHGLLSPLHRWCLVRGGDVVRGRWVSGRPEPGSWWFVKKKRLFWNWSRTGVWFEDWGVSPNLGKSSVLHVDKGAEMAEGFLWSVCDVDATKQSAVSQSRWPEASLIGFKGKGYRRERQHSEKITTQSAPVLPCFCALQATMIGQIHRVVPEKKSSESVPFRSVLHHIWSSGVSQMGVAWNKQIQQTQTLPCNKPQAFHNRVAGPTGQAFGISLMTPHLNTSWMIRWFLQNFNNILSVKGWPRPAKKVGKTRSNSEYVKLSLSCEKVWCVCQMVEFFLFLPKEWSNKAWHHVEFWKIG